MLTYLCQQWRDEDKEDVVEEQSDEQDAADLKTDTKIWKLALVAGGLKSGNILNWIVILGFTTVYHFNYSRQYLSDNMNNAVLFAKILWPHEICGLRWEGAVNTKY